MIRIAKCLFQPFSIFKHLFNIEENQNWNIGRLASPCPNYSLKVRHMKRLEVPEMLKSKFQKGFKKV